MANFLDRIAYKNPKSVEKIAKFSSGRRMAATEQPINLYDFSGTGGENDMPQNLREEEQYLYKYFKMRGPKPTATKKKGDEESDDDADLSNKLDGSDLEGEDSEMEAFANQVIEKEMKKMTKQQDDLDDEVLSGLSDEEIDEDGEDDMDEEDMEDDLEEDDEGDFFDGEDGLQEVKVGEEDEEDSEMEMGGDDDEDEDEVQEYVDEEEDEEDDDIFDKKGNKGAKSKDNGKKKKEQKSIFADYDEFAHLLEGDMYDGGQGGKKSKDFPSSTAGYSGSKRPHHRGGHRGGSRGGSH